MSNLKVGYGILLSVPMTDKLKKAQEISVAKFGLTPLPEDKLHITLLSGKSIPKEIQKLLKNGAFKPSFNTQISIKYDDSVYHANRDSKSSSFVFIQNQLDLKLLRNKLLSEISEFIKNSGSDLGFELIDYDQNRQYHVTVANNGDGNPYNSIGDIGLDDKKHGFVINEYFDGFEPEVTFDNPDNDIAKMNTTQAHLYAPAVGQGNRHFLSENDTTSKENILKVINALPFADFIKQMGGDLYAVGGVVRDSIMGKSSDDLDIVVTKVPLDTLIPELEKYGSASFTGTNFGVINFKPSSPELSELIKSSGFDEVIDIALPRKDMAGDGGTHQDIEAKVDPNMPIEADLERRDFTINSIALKSDGTLIDPFNGLEAIKSKEIHWTNPESFLDDPLRMLRAIRFAAVYNYNISKETKHAIKINRQNIKNVPYERFNLEFSKMLKKGGGKIFKNAIKLMIETDLFRIIFGFNFNGNLNDFDKVTSLSEFGWYLFKDESDSPEAMFMDKIRGDVKSAKEIKAFKLSKHITNDKLNNKWIIFNTNSIAPSALESHIFTDRIGGIIDEMRQNNEPFSYKELVIDGNDLMHFGFKGPDIKKKQEQIVNQIFMGELKNDRDEILMTLDAENENPDSLNETIKRIKKMI